MTDTILNFLKESKNDLIIATISFGINIAIINNVIKYRQKKDFNKKWSQIRLILYADILELITKFYRPYFTNEFYIKKLIEIPTGLSTRQVLSQVQLYEFSAITETLSHDDSIDIENLCALRDELFSLIERFNVVVDTDLTIKILELKQSIDDLTNNPSERKVGMFKILHNIFMLQYIIFENVSEFKRYIKR